MQKNPFIMILSEVLHFIEEEVMTFDSALETGGLLLGTKTANGRLITHAIPSGPNALHRPGMFERDLEFSQAALNYFANQCGVDYVGEWHKHPECMMDPSEGDREGVIQIIKDPDYNIDDLLVFPIWIRKSSSNSTHRSFHDRFIENHCRITKRTIQCFPYYMDESLAFHPFEFEIAPCDIGAQIRVEKFYRNYLHSNGIENAKDISPIENQALSKCTKTDEGGINPNNRKKRKEGRSSVNFPDHYLKETKHQQCPQWFDKTVGKQRLIDETKSAKRTGCYKDVILLPIGRISFRFKSQTHKGVLLIIVCKKDHPLSFPDILLAYNDKYFDVISCIAPKEDPQAFYKMKQQMVTLNQEWRCSEGEMLIADIAATFGFSCLDKQQ